MEVGDDDNQQDQHHEDDARASSEDVEACLLAHGMFRHAKSQRVGQHNYISHGNQSISSNSAPSSAAEEDAFSSLLPASADLLSLLMASPSFSSCSRTFSV